MLQNTLYLNGSGKLSLNSPCQVQGSVRVQGAMQLGSDYNWTAAMQQRYLGDLNAMRLAHLADYRPLTGNIFLPTNSTDPTTLSLLTAQLGLTVTNTSAASSSAIPMPSALTKYQIYSGGPTYQVGVVGSTISSVTLAPDPATNPLGIFFCNSTVTIGNNVSIAGTLISAGDVDISGTGVVLAAFAMPSLAGSTTPIRLPAIVANNSVHFNSGVSASITGTVIAAGPVTVDQGSQTDSLALTGHVIAGSDFTIHGRNESLLTALLWSSHYSAFQLQLLLPTKVLYFPSYLSVFSMNPNALLTLKADTTLLLDHWQDLAGPIYVPAAGDGGLRWELLSWTNNI
jgi:hypothetical protein